MTVSRSPDEDQQLGSTVDGSWTSAGRKATASAFVWGRRLPEDQLPTKSKFLPGALALGQM